MLPDRLFYPLAALAAALIVGLALNWPLGQGAPARPITTGLHMPAAASPTSPKGPQ